MFEGWLGEIITRFVGHFLDVKKEQLRVSLWSGWSTSLVLENVRLKVEAFEYLQLPFNIAEGCIGKLEIQVPWRALQSRPVVVHLSDVWLCACPRTEEEWEEDMAGKRAQAAKQAELAALDLIRLSKPGGKVAGAGNEGSSLASSFLSHLGTMLLNKLQMTIRNIHFCFKDYGASENPGTEFGLRLQLLETTDMASIHLGVVPVGAQLVKDMHVEGLSLYWRTTDSSASSRAGIDTVGAWLDTTDAVASSYQEEVPLEGAILPCLDCSLRLTTTQGKGETECGVTVVVQRVEMQLQQAQLHSMVAFADRATIWSLRSKYAVYRPAGWRSDPHSSVSWRRVWQYAIKAVLLDVKKSARWLSFKEMSKWQQQRRQYEKLHLRRLDTLRKAQEPEEADVAGDLEALEASLPVSVIVLYRVLAEHRMQQADALPSVDGESAQQTIENARQQGWLGWGVSSIAGYLGYVPSQDAPRQLSPPSESDIQELFHDLGFDPHTQVDTRGVSGTVGINVHVRVNAALLLILDGPAAAEDSSIVSIEAGDASIEALMRAGRVQLTCSVHDIAGHDLCTHGGGVSEVLLARWDKDAASPSNNDADASSPFMENSSSMFSSSFLDEESTLEPQAPALHLHYDSRAPKQQVDTVGDDHSSTSHSQPKMEVVIQPLQLLHRSACIARLQGVLSGMPDDLHSNEVLHAINHMASPAGRSLAKAELALKAGQSAMLHVKVVDFMFMSGGSINNRRHAHAAFCTGSVELQSSQQLHPTEIQTIVTDLRTAVHANGAMQSWQRIAEQVELNVLYITFEMNAASVRLEVSSAANPSRKAMQVLYPLRISLSLRKGKLPDRLLPQIRVQVSVDPLEISLTPEQLAVLRQIADVEQGADPMPAQRPAAASNIERIGTVSSVPQVEITGRIAGLVATFDDCRGTGCDAEDTHLMLRAGHYDFVTNIYDESIHCTGTLKELDVSDSSVYTVSPPRIWGRSPRLASHLSIQQTAFLFEHKSGLGFMVSCELSGAEAEGFQGESGNFIRRLRSSIPATAMITHINTSLQLQTSVTLQDGCFGAGALMRIAALFVQPEKEEGAEAASAPLTAAQVQATPAINIASPATKEGTSQLQSGTLGTSQEPMHGCSLQPGSSQPTGHSTSTEPGETSHSDLDRWESASGSFDVEGTARRSRDGSSSPSTHAAERPPDQGGIAQELFVLDEEMFESPSDPSSDRSGQSSDRRSTANQAEAAHRAAQLEDHVQPEEGAEAAYAGKTPPARLDQFSLQILRCRVLCPDWRDTSFAPGTPREVEDGHALVLDAPDFLLQLPPQAPAQHPSVHPVLEHRSGAPAQPAGAAQPSSNAKQENMSEMQETADAQTLSQGSDAGQLVAAGAQLGFHVQVFDPGTGSVYGPRKPFLGIPAFMVLVHDGLPSVGELQCQSSSGQQPAPLYNVSADSIQVTADPNSLQVLTAAAEWGRSEMAHLVGVARQQAPEGAQRMHAAHSSGLLDGPPYRLSVKIDSVTVRINGVDEAEPTLLVGLHALSGEVCKAPDAFIGSVSMEKLLVQLAGMPDSDPMDSQEHDMVLQRPGASLMGRSASAPSALRRRTGTVLDPLPSWGGELDLVEAGSSSSISSVTSETPRPAVRTTSTGLAELASLGSSPDTWANPVISGRRGSDALSWSTAIDATIQDIAELDIPKSADVSSHGSPSASSALSQQDSGDTFYNASSGAFSGALHRVSSSGTDTSGGSGTEWFEAADYDSDTFGTASSAGTPLDVNGAVDDETKGTQVALLLIQGVSQDRNFLQGLHAGSDESHATLRAGVSLHMREHGGTSLTSTGVHVRLFVQGWVIVVARLQACMAALKKGEVHPAARHSRDGVMEEHAEQRDGHFVSVAAGGLLVEMVANNHSGSPCVPYISGSVSLHGSGMVTGNGVHVSEVALQKVAVRVGLAQQDGNNASLSKQQDAGIVCAVRGAEVKLRTGKDEGSQFEQRWEINLEKVSVWSSESRLGIAIAFAMAVQDLPHELTGDNTPAEIAKAKVAGSEWIAGCASLRIGSAALLLSSDTNYSDLPIFDASMSDVSADAMLEDGQVGGTLTCQIGANVYCRKKDGWEPVIEPWRFAMDVSALFPRDEGDALPASDVQQALSITASEPLNLTATFTLIEAIHKSVILLDRLRSLANAPHQLEAALDSSLHERGSAHSSACWVQNDTGIPVQCWLSTPVPLQAKEPGEEGIVMLEPGGHAALSLPSVVSPSCQSQLASCPELFFEEDQASTLAASGSLAALQKAINGRKPPPAPMALCFKLEGQDGFCGPLPLDKEAHGMQDVAVRTARASGLTRTHLAFSVSSMRTGEPTVLLHSGVQVVNHTMLRLNVGERTSLNRDVRTISTLASQESLCLSALRSEPGLICFQPAGEQDEASHYQWSPSIRLQPLLDLVKPSGKGDSPDTDSAPRIARHLACQAAQGGLLQASFCVGVVSSRSRAGWDLIVKAPLVVENALPMPTEISLKRRSTGGAPMRDVWCRQLRRDVAVNQSVLCSLSLRPRQPAFLHHLDITHLAEIVIQPFGYLKSPPVRVPALRKATEGSLPTTRSAPEEETAAVSFPVTQAGESGGSATVQLKRMVDAESGSHILRLTCALWVYNCTGVPLALQQSEMDDSSRDDDEVLEDEVPKQWVPPFEGKSRPSSGAAKPPAKSKASEGSSSGSLQGLEQVLVVLRDTVQRRSSQPPRNRSASRLGVAESLESLPSYSTPTRWPSMQGGLLPYRRRVRMQLRASNMRAPFGRTYWSDPVQLDSLGGAAVVSVPCPLAGPSSMMPDPRSAYMLSVTANQVPGADGALAVVVMPRYVLHNSLGLRLQYKQQGTATERELVAGGARPLRWTDSALPKRLCLRVQEAGWLWSGGIALDSPGDLFVKIRHRDRGVTMLVRVDICAAEGGVLVINVSHQAAGFAPYRLDNCSSEILHLRQFGCEEQEDVLRPYSHLNYAWDEPSLPHKLLLSLPGNHVLGIFNLDKVGQSYMVTAPGNPQYHVRDRSLQVVIRAEGPTCVLTVADLQVHAMLPVSLADGSAADDLGWERWSGPPAEKHGALFSSQAVAVRAPSALQVEVQLDLAGLGLSFTRPTQEVFYVNLSGILARATTSKVRHTLELEIRSIQVDNPDREAIYPVVLAMPAAAPGLNLSILPETLPAGSQSRSSALRARAAAWKRRPAGVLCVERLEVHTAPLVLEIDQQHITDILAALNEAMQPFQGPHTTEKRKPGLELDVDVLAPGYNTRQLQQLKVYIAHLFVSRITVYMSFLPAEWRQASAASAEYSSGGRGIGTGMQRLVALVGEVEGGRISLAPLRMEHPLLGTTALQQQVYSHYMRAALPELVKLVGSANVLGDPVRLFHHLGAGVWSFLASPAAGLVEGARGRAPQRLAAGIAAGLRGLLSNTVYGFSNATAKMSGAARKGLVVLGLEPRDAAAGPLRARLRSSMSQRGDVALLEPGFLGALLNGLVGILSEPVRGADEGGLPGLVRGTGRGVVGALVLPLAAVLETSMRVADSIRSAVMGIPPLLPRARPPRHIDPDLPLMPYNWSEAMGRALLMGLERGHYASEPFLLCRQLAAGLEFAVLTRRRLLCICAPSQTAPPTLRWAVALEDLFNIRRVEASLVVVALQPSVVQPASPIALLRRPPLVRPSRSPCFSAVLPCKDEADAEMLHQAVEYAQGAAQLQSLAPLLQRISHSQQWWQARAAAGLPAPQAAVLASAETCTGRELNGRGMNVRRLLSEELADVGKRQELLAAQILAAVRNPASV